MNKQNCNNTRYEQFLSEIENIYDLININNECIENVNMEKVSCCPFRKVYTDTTKIHKFIIDMEIDLMFVTIIGGGGAGGIGYIKNMYYYSGGGGGASACFIKKPIEVKKGSILKIKVGKGGNINCCRDGEDSFVEILTCDNNKNIVCVEGGKNGKSSLCFDGKVDGGKGGKNSYNKCFDGKDGKNGSISIPSQFLCYGGMGGNSHFYLGGDGGGSYFSLGGNGGNGGNSANIIGCDGKYGSGGGGSAPKCNIDKNEKLSGDGGDGIVIIEWY